MSAMGYEQMLLESSMDIIRKEVKSIADAVITDSKETLKKDAESIAQCFLLANSLADPVTLARASFYLALKDNRMRCKDSVKKIIHNNGTKNEWWTYLVPVLEKHYIRK
ncbi:hypothetical protein MUP59_00790 [Candidatus Bathyarchaeota archaeon]|nr:hypothetical protein [Candidatus Bathyarchaeota archaeon]